MDQAIQLEKIERLTKSCSNCVQKSIQIVSKSLKTDIFSSRKFIFYSHISIASDLYCCSATSIKVMAASIRMAAGVYGRCDTCMRNLYKQICALNCSPKQSDFLVPTNGSKEKDDKTGNGRWKKLQNPQSLTKLLFYILNFCSDCCCVRRLLHQRGVCGWCFWQL